MVAFPSNGNSGNVNQDNDDSGKQVAIAPAVPLSFSAGGLTVHVHPSATGMLVVVMVDGVELASFRLANNPSACLCGPGGRLMLAIGASGLTQVFRFDAAGEITGRCDVDFSPVGKEGGDDSSDNPAAE